MRYENKLNQANSMAFEWICDEMSSTVAKCLRVLVLRRHYELYIFAGGSLSHARRRCLGDGCPGTWAALFSRFMFTKPLLSFRPPHILISEQKHQSSFEPSSLRKIVQQELILVELSRKELIR